MILVAGGSGFIGAAVVRELAGRGERVRVLTRSPARVRAKFAGLDVEPAEGDVAAPGTLSRAMEGCEAAVASMQFQGFPVEQPRKGWTFAEVDGRGTERLVGAAKEAGVRVFVYVSGVGAAPDAARHWFRVKWQAEQAVAGSGMEYAVFRPSWVYGPEDSALNRFVGFARRLPLLPVIGSGAQRLQPVFVRDVAWCIAESLARPETRGRAYEIGGPDVLTMDEILRAMLRVMGRRRRLLHVPAWTVRAAAHVLRRLPNPPLSPDAVAFVTGDAVADNTALLQTFAPRLTPLEEGLASYLSPRGPQETGAAS